MEINSFIKARLDIGIKTGTVRRNFNSINAVFNKVNTEHEIDHFHRFNSPNIPHLGEDKKDRKDFTAKELLTLSEATKDSSNTTDQIIGLLIDTGMRCGEVVGLACEDIVLNAQPSHLILHKNIHRRLKTKSSQRVIPLVGTSLCVAKNLNLEGGWVFNKYIDDTTEQFKTNSANNTVNNRIRVILKNTSSPSSHSFRHTLATRLRDAECPEYMRKEIGGWATSLSEKYGSPTDLQVKAEYIKKSINY
jgi:integrase